MDKWKMELNKNNLKIEINDSEVTNWRIYGDAGMQLC